MSSSERVAAQSKTERGAKRPIAPMIYGLLVGIAGGIVGLAPWLITGARLPLQNLWATEVMPDRMPVSLLPLNQYELVTIVVLLVLGGAIAGIAIRVWNPTQYKVVVRSAVIGVGAVHLAATIQSFTVLHSGLLEAYSATIYFLGILFGVILSLAAALVLLLLLTSRSRARVALAVGLLSVPLAAWLIQWVIGFTGPVNLPAWSSFMARWLPALIVGAALAWFGFRSIRHLAVWVTNLALLWLVPALFVSISYVFGSRVRLGNLSEMLHLTRQILTSTLGPEGGAAPVVLLALIIAILGAGIRFVVGPKNHPNRSPRLREPSARESQ